MQRLDSSSVLVHDKLMSSTTLHCSGGSKNINVSEAVRTEENSNTGPVKEAIHVEKIENANVLSISRSESNIIPDKSIGSDSLRSVKQSGDVVKPGERSPTAPPEDSKLSVNRLSFLPELIASVKRAALEGAEEVKARVEENADSGQPDSVLKETPANESKLSVSMKSNFFSKSMMLYIQFLMSCLSCRTHMGKWRRNLIMTM